jgi:hypothetical protein
VRTEPSQARSIYRLNFVLHIVEDGQDTPRQYALLLEEKSQGKIRALTRVPVRESADRITWIETGMKCDAQYQEIEGMLRLEVETHFSDMPSARTAEAPPVQEWQSRVELSIVPNELTLLSTYDGGENNRKYSLEVRAEKVR